MGNINTAKFARLETVVHHVVWIFNIIIKLLLKLISIIPKHELTDFCGIYTFYTQHPKYLQSTDNQFFTFILQFIYLIIYNYLSYKLVILQ